ncbi:hypothetical protein ACFWOL_13375 [Streptomyces sp. NPDC058442]|uniref:hypothetical protein n=1 Tax=Streptomyces sp. NPDC058442 TaxID=3346503 RepID=UPI003651CA8D
MCRLSGSGGIRGDRALVSRPWKVLWIARPADRCPEAVGDRLREDTLDNAFADLLAPCASAEDSCQCSSAVPSPLSKLWLSTAIGWWVYGDAGWTR